YIEPAPSGFRPSLLPHAYFGRSHLASVYIANPGPGGGASNTVKVLIGAPKPSLKSLSPDTATPVQGAFRLQIKGNSLIPSDPHDLGNPNAKGFAEDSVVLWNGD